MSESLYQFFLRHNDIPSGAEQIAITAFEQRLEDKSWRPSNPHFGGFIPIIELGLLIHILEGASNINSRVTELIVRYVSEGRLDRDCLAELHVGALLTRLGAEVSYLTPLSGTRAPDISARCDSMKVDVEVVRADQRQQHQEHQRMLAVLTEAISMPRDASYGIFIASELEHDLLERIVDAVLATAPGQRTEVAGEWCVVAGTEEEGDKFVGGGFEALAPEWWEKGGPSFRSVSRMVDPASPAVQVCTKVPLTSYINPIRRKAERPQRTGDYPYVIALDTSELPGPDRVTGELEGFLALWPDVSGVLLMMPFFAILGPRTWRTWFIPNPHAARPMASVPCVSKLAAHRVDIGTGY